MEQFQSSNPLQKLTTPSQGPKTLEELRLKIIELDRKITEIQGYREAVDELNLGIEELKSKSEKMQKDNDILSQKMDNSEKENTKKSMEILGVFVAIITVVSVSTTTALQIHSVYHALLFIIAFSLCLLSFISILIFLLRYDKKSICLCTLSLLILLCIGISMFFYCEKKEKELIIQKNTSLTSQQIINPVSNNDYKNPL